MNSDQIEMSMATNPDGHVPSPDTECRINWLLTEISRTIKFFYEMGIFFVAEIFFLPLKGTFLFFF